jgi:hypothetical protein
MKYKVYVQDECEFCQQVELPEGINVEKVYINRDDFEGYIPEKIPVLQFKTFQLEGPYQINEFFKMIKDAKQE